MTVCILIDGAETHKAFNVVCNTRRQVVDTSTLGGGGLEEVGRTTTCTMVTETQPKRMGIYELRCKDESCSCKRFQVLEVSKRGDKFQITGVKLSDEGL